MSSAVAGARPTRSRRDRPPRHGHRGRDPPDRGARVSRRALTPPSASREFIAEVRDQDGKLFTQAGGHPFVGVTDFTFNTTGTGAPDGNVKDIRVDVPPGLISNPEATPKCTDAHVPGLPAVDASSVPSS